MLLCLVVRGKMIIIDLNPETFMIELHPIFKRYMALKKTFFFKTKAFNRFPSKSLP